MKKRQHTCILILIVISCFICAAQNVPIKPLFHPFFHNHQVTFVGYGSSDWKSLQPFNAEIRINQTALENVNISNLEESSLPINLIFVVDGSKDFLKTNRLWITELILQFASDPLSKDQKKLRIGMLHDNAELQFFSPEDQAAIITAVEHLDLTTSDMDFENKLLNSIDSIEQNDSSLSGLNQIVLITDGSGYNENQINKEKIEQKITSSGITVHLLDMVKTDTELINSSVPNWFTEFVFDTGGSVTSAENINQTAVFKDRLLSTINKKLVIQGTIPDKLISKDSDPILLSLSVIKNQTILAKITQTVSLPPAFFQPAVSIAIEFEPLIEATVVPKLNEDGFRLTANSEMVMDATRVPVFQSFFTAASPIISKTLTMTSLPTSSPTVAASPTRIPSATSSPLPATSRTNTYLPVPLKPTFILTTASLTALDTVLSEENRQEKSKSDQKAFCIHNQCFKIPSFLQEENIHKISEFLEKHLFEVTLTLYASLVFFLIVFTSIKILQYKIRRKKSDMNQKEEKKNRN